jgi:hypothetical protein
MGTPYHSMLAAYGASALAASHAGRACFAGIGEKWLRFYPMQWPPR